MAAPSGTVDSVPSPSPSPFFFFFWVQLGAFIPKKKSRRGEIRDEADSGTGKGKFISQYCNPDVVNTLRSCLFVMIRKDYIIYLLYLVFVWSSDYRANEISPAIFQMFFIPPF